MTSILKIFISALFVSFLLAKLTDMNTKFQQAPGNNELLNSIFNQIKFFLDSMNVKSIESLNVVNLGTGYEGTSHIANFLITYTPIFFVIFLILHLIAKPFESKNK